MEIESKLWVLPGLGGAPHPLKGLLGHAATWTADGKGFVYGNGKDVWLVKHEGEDAKKLASLPGVASWLRWSPDASRLRFTLNDPSDGSNSLWEIAADGSQLHPVFKGWHQPSDECCGNWTPDGRYFCFQATENGQSQIFCVDERRGLFAGENKPLRLTEGPLSYYSPVPTLDT